MHYYGMSIFLCPVRRLFPSEKVHWGSNGYWMDLRQTVEGLHWRTPADQLVLPILLTPLFFFCYCTRIIIVLKETCEITIERLLFLSKVHFSLINYKHPAL